MNRGDLADVATLIDRARELYSGDAATTEVLDAYALRLREPLRVAVAGMVKAGKSTLLNALIGERIAPTDAGECTRTITWYRHAASPRIVVHLRDGGQERMPVRREHGRLVLDLGRRAADEVAWIDVAWPSEELRRCVLIDTPGIASLSADASLRSSNFLTPADGPSVADAIVYLLRHVHAADLNFLEAFRDTSAGASETVNALAVLSRADEIGSGRIDSLLSAQRIAERYRRDGELRSLAIDVLPVAGLLAEGARTLRESEFAALRALAQLDHATREALLVSVDRFVRPYPDAPVSVEDRQLLLERFGIFGVRLGAAIVRSGVTDSSDLAERMIQQSGLNDVQRFIVTQFRARAAVLKTRGVLGGLETLVRERPRAGDADLLAGIERAIASMHELRELSLLAQLRTSGDALSPELVEEAERLIGGHGTEPLIRLGLPRGTSAAAVRERVDELLVTWRMRAESPLSSRPDVDRCRLVVRSIEGAASEFSAAVAGRGASADVALAGSPAQRSR